MTKKLALAAVVVIVFAGHLCANPVGWGGFALFSDPQGTDAFIIDEMPGLLVIYVVQGYTIGDGATAAQFSAPQPECFEATYISDTQIFPVTIGNSQTGVAVGYGQCLTAPIHVLSINYFGEGLTGECCFYWLQPDPNVPSGEIEVVDCNSQLVFMPGGAGVINPDEGLCGTPVEPSTWGKVKSLYKEK
ncbi:MAG: hypothetical protein JSW58_03735 [Candidatus Latescibacterota bacterium]|nr:MAG: hypothetical protein JSW58_03735 [Candidatus Latescibacterota bacterium]